MPAFKDLGYTCFEEHKQRVMEGINDNDKIV